ncbi:hypothetical protein BDZ91DRAFT_716364 [Kalaharituber pfeilii]|nr:hypothetical protein BDZ91DRAFT_716364 [Kalaharituber pfeilii]
MISQFYFPCIFFSFFFLTSLSLDFSFATSICMGEVIIMIKMRVYCAHVGVRGYGVLLPSR